VSASCPAPAPSALLGAGLHLNQLSRFRGPAQALLKEAILDHLEAHSDGLRNGDLAKDLGLESSHDGRQQDYLTYSVLGLLMKEQQIDKVRRGGKAYYVRAR
jgi:hypothetical protein